MTTAVRPQLGPPPAVRLPETAGCMLEAGASALVVRRPGVPLVELRLVVPFAGSSAALRARADLLAETLLTGTATRDRLALASDIQRLGGSVSVGCDADRLVLSASALAAYLDPLLELIADVVVGANFPDDEVSGEVERIQAELVIARSQPGVLAREALLARLYPDHPYGQELPSAEEVAAVTPDGLRELHRAQVVADGAHLVVVGDLDPQQALERAAAALSGWQGRAQAAPMPPLPAHQTGAVVLHDRPGAVQTNIRLGGPALARTDPGFAALQIANTIYGGYFTSRLVANIREDKGYTYSPRSGLEHPRAGSRITVAADVATEVTAAALLEITYELGRMVTTPVSQEELDAARQYVIGTLALSTATQAGLAGTLAALVPTGLGVEWLAEHPRALAEVTTDDVLAAAQRYLSPAGLVTVLLGDAARIADEVARLGPLTRA